MIFVDSVEESAAWILVDEKKAETEFAKKVDFWQIRAKPVYFVI